MANSPATNFTISEYEPGKGFIGYIVQLYERALPYRPVTFGGKQRVEFTWYPGSPMATAQVLGPEEDAISLKGFWKDRFLGEQPGMFSYLAPEGGGIVFTAAEAVNIVDTMRRRGQLCRLEWSGLVRDGHITAFRQTWHNLHDVEWELEFTPISQGESVKSVASPPLPAIVDLSEAWEVANSKWETRRQELPGAGLAGDIAQFLDEVDDAVLGFTNAVTRTVTGAVDTALSGPDALNRLVAIGQGVTVQVAATLVTVCDAADEVIFPILGAQAVEDLTFGVVAAPGLALPDDLSLTETINAAVYKATVKESLVGIRNVTLESTTQYQNVLNPDLLQTFIAQQDTDLRDVSTGFYGTPDEWRNLMLFNRMTTSKLSAGDLIFVPAQGNSGNSVAVPGSAP